MTDDRTLERAARSWLEAGPTRAPEAAVAAALERIQTTTQERGPWIPWRLPRMILWTRLAAGAAVVLAVILAGILAGGVLVKPLPSPIPTIVGTPGPSGAASPAPSASPARTPVASLPPLGAASPVVIDLKASIPAGYGIGPVAVGPDGNVYALDDRPIVSVLRPDGTVIRQWGRAGNGPGEINSQWTYHMAIAADGTVYISDTTGSDLTTDPSRVQAFSSSGTYLRGWGSFGSGPGQFEDISGLAIAPDGNVVTIDARRSVVSIFKPDGTFVSQFGQPGTAADKIGNTGPVLVAPDGTIENLDIDGSRIQRWATGGAFLGVWGTLGIGPGQFIDLRDAAVAPDGRLYVLDSRRIQVFDGTGEPVEELKNPQSGLYSIAVDASHLWLPAGQGLIRYDLTP